MHTHRTQDSYGFDLVFFIYEWAKNVFFTKLCGTIYQSSTTKSHTQKTEINTSMLGEGLPGADNSKNSDIFIANDS